MQALETVAAIPQLEYRAIGRTMCGVEATFLQYILGVLGCLYLVPHLYAMCLYELVQVKIAGRSIVIEPVLLFGFGKIRRDLGEILVSGSLDLLRDFDDLAFSLRSIFCVIPLAAYCPI